MNDFTTHTLHETLVKVKLFKVIVYALYYRSVGMTMYQVLFSH